MPQPRDTFAAATGGHKSVPADWMPATGLRALIQEDPAILWLKFFGAAHGFEQDTKDYSFLEFIGENGRQFEAAFVRNVAPEAVLALDEDTDVRRADGLRRTLELMAQRVPVITKAALWWAPERVYGSADLICLTSWLYERFPHLRPDGDDQPDIYVVLDCKFTTRLDKSDKATDLACNAAQVRTYSFILAHLQGQMPDTAYLVTRDRVSDPLPVSVDMQIGKPLDPRLAEQRDLYIHIKTEGGKYLPWRDDIVAPNWSNSHDEPWHCAKKKIAADYMPGRPLESLPFIGRRQAGALRALGYSCLEDVLAAKPGEIPFQTIYGLGRDRAARIEAVLTAARTGKPSYVPPDLVPARRDENLFVDFEYLSNVHVQFDQEWPELQGCDMIFLIGVAWFEGGEWKFERFVAARESRDAERDMLVEFGRFLKARGVFDPRRSAALFHWTAAEVFQSARAAERHGLDWLSRLPWVDLQAPFKAGPIALPGALGDCGLKSMATALPDGYRVEWPAGLGAGLNAMVMGFAAYEQAEPAKTPEMAMLCEYLRVDCIATGQVLRWLRHAAATQQQKQQREASRGFWYPIPRNHAEPSRCLSGAASLHPLNIG